MSRMRIREQGCGGLCPSPALPHRDEATDPPTGAKETGGARMSPALTEKDFASNLHLINKTVIGGAFPSISN